MLHLKTADGARLEIPATAIIAVMKPSDGVNPCAIIFDMGAGPQVDQLSDQYGFVKKLANDGQALVNPIELRIIEQLNVGDGAEAMTAHGEGRIFFARDRISGRREVKGDPHGINATIYVNLFGQPTSISVADTLDEMDGVEPTPAPARKVRATQPKIKAGE